MKIRKMRKQFWSLLNSLHRKHMRKVKPLPGTYWSGYGKGLQLKERE